MVQTRKEQINILRAFWSKYTYTATGGASSDNIAGATLNAASVTGTDGGETSTPTRGIVTTGASNLVRLRTESDGYYIFDNTNDLIFGRLTYSAPNYVVSYYKISGGSEISTTLPGSIGDVEMLYPEVMNFGEIPANAHIIDEAGFGFQDTAIGGGGGGGGGGSLTPPNDPADDNKVAYASGGDLAYATNVLTDGSSYVSIGATPASGGQLRLANTATITARDNGDSADLTLIDSGTNDYVRVGGDGSNVLGASLYSNSSEIFRVQSAGVTIQNTSLMQFSGSSSNNPTIRQANTGSGDGDTFTIQAQNATGGGTDGGDLVLNSGTGTNDDGYVYIQNGGTDTMEIGSGNVTINGKLTVTGLIDPTGLQLDPQGSSPANNSIWIENTSPTVLKFTNNAGSTITLGSGGGLTPPNDPADDNKVSYASGGDLAYATNVFTDGSYVSIGATTATAGSLRLANAGSITARNNADSADVSLITLNSSDQTEIQGATTIVDDDYVSIAGGVGTVASTGELRLPYKAVSSNGGIFFRNSSDSDDIQALSAGPSNRLYLGGQGSQGITFINGTPQITFMLNGTVKATLSSVGNSGLKLFDENIYFDNAAVNPIVWQEDIATGSTNGQPLTIQAQNATGTTSDGGNLVLTSGTGTSEDGYVYIQNGGTDIMEIGSGNVTINGKLTVTGLIDPTGLQLDPQGSSPANNTIWISNDSPTELKFTDSSGSTTTLGSGGGLTPPNDPADDGKLAYASGGDLVYSSITTDGDDLAFASTNGSPQLSQADIAGSDATDLLVQAQSATGSAVSGGNLLLRGGTGGSSGTGGDCSGGGVTLIGRDGFAPGGNVASDGGGISLLAGDGDAVGAGSIGANGRGGSIEITAGDSTTSGTLSAGVKGGDINVSSGDGVAGTGQSGNGGDIDINTGFGDVNGSGGDFTVSCGEGGSNGDGGVMIFTAGNGGLSGGAGGSVTLNGGTGQNTNGAGGSIFINSGPAGGVGASDGIIALDVDDSGSSDAEIQLRIQGTTWMYLTSNRNSRNEILFSNSVTNPTIAVETVSGSSAETLSILGQAVTGSGDLSGGSVNITATSASSSSSGASSTGGSVNVTCGDGSSSGNVKSNGGDFTVTAGDGSIRSNGSIGTDTGRGGNITLNAGDATNPGTLFSGAPGGFVSINAGDGTAGTGQSGSGGTVIITSGAGSVNGSGGTLSLTAGDGGSSGDGGSIEIIGGDTNGASNIGGNIDITAGANSDNNDGGGVITITGGSGDSAANGGQVNIIGGEQTGIGASVNITGGASSSSGNAGDVNLTGGTPTSGAGGDIRLTSASGAGTNQNAGNIILQLGSGTGTGNNGVVYLETASGIVMTESATAPSNSLVGSATKGTLWVRDDSPCVLIFTDDAGTDHVIAFSP